MLPLQPLSTAEPQRETPTGILLRRILADADRTTAPMGRDPELMALLFAADRRDHYVRVVRPALDEGRVVVADRSVWSSVVYQGRGVPERIARVQQLNSTVPLPDLTVVLRVPPEVALERRKYRNFTPELFEYEELQRELAPLYDAMHGLRSVVQVEGTGTAAEVHRRVWNAVQQLILLTQVR